MHLKINKSIEFSLAIHLFGLFFPDFIGSLHFRPNKPPSAFNWYRMYLRTIQIRNTKCQWHMTHVTHAQSSVFTIISTRMLGYGSIVRTNTAIMEMQCVAFRNDEEHRWFWEPDIFHLAAIKLSGRTMLPWIIFWVRQSFHICPFAIFMICLASNFDVCDFVQVLMAFRLDPFSWKNWPAREIFVEAAIGWERRT